MTYGEKITYACKPKKTTPDHLGKAVGTSADIIGKYERDKIKPFIETASKIADALCVALNYLVKDGAYQNIYNIALKRLKLIEKLPKDERSHIFATMDAFFAKNKLQALLKYF